MFEFIKRLFNKKETELYIVPEVREVKISKYKILDALFKKYPEFGDFVKYRFDVKKREQPILFNHFLPTNGETIYDIVVYWINGNERDPEWRGNEYAPEIIEGVWFAYVKDGRVTDLRTYFVF